MRATRLFAVIGVSVCASVVVAILILADIVSLPRWVGVIAVIGAAVAAFVPLAFLMLPTDDELEPQSDEIVQPAMSPNWSRWLP